MAAWGMREFIGSKRQKLGLHWGPAVGFRAHGRCNGSHCAQALMLGQQRKLPLSTMGAHAAQKSLPCSFPIRERDMALEDTWADVHNGQGHSSSLVAHHVQRQDWHIILQPGIQHAVQHLPAHHPHTCTTNAHHLERLFGPVWAAIRVILTESMALPSKPLLLCAVRPVTM